MLPILLGEFIDACNASRKIELESLKPEEEEEGEPKMRMSLISRETGVMGAGMQISLFSGRGRSGGRDLPVLV